MKKFFFILIEIIFIIIYVYILSIDSIPNNIILFQDESLDITPFLGISCEKIDNDDTSIEVSSNINGTTTVAQKSTLLFKLFDKITLKSVNVDVISNVKVVPVGNIIGLKLYTKGVLVVGMNEVENADKEKTEPYKDSGIVEGDMIITINDRSITCTADLLEEVSKSNGENLEVEYVRDGNLYETSITPEKIEENQYKLGLWVRDSAAGVGTITFYEPATGKFAALGHGIMDVDTGELLEIANGEIVTTNILSVVKGEKGNPR